MKIAHLLPNLTCGGTERGVLELARAAAKKNLPTIVVSGGGRLTAELYECGSRHYTLPIFSKDAQDLSTISAQLAFVLKFEEVNVVDVHSRAPAKILAHALNKMTRRPAVVATCHGDYEVNEESLPMFASDKVIVVSDYLRSYFEERQAPINAKNLEVIHRGVDTDFFSPKFNAGEAWKRKFFAENPELQGKRMITLASRITERKGHLDFAAVAKAIGTVRNDVAFVFVGEANPGNESFTAAVAEAYRQARVPHYVFLGFRPDIREILSVSHVAVNPSPAPEAFGRSVLEALAMGVPVVSYDLGGARETMSQLFPEGLVTAGDSQMFVSKTLEFLENKPEIKSAKMFHLDTMIEKTLDLYRRAHAANIFLPIKNSSSRDLPRADSERDFTI